MHLIISFEIKSAPVRAQKIPAAIAAGQRDFMKGFIEVTDANNNEKALISIASIKFVEVSEGYTRIVLNCVAGKSNKLPWVSLSVPVMETYAEIVSKIAHGLE